MGVCEHLFYTNVNTWVYTCVCERACVHKVPPCKRLIVCVGNNSPIPQGMKQARKRPGPQTSGGPPGHGTPRRTTAGTIAASTQKGQRRARRRDLRQPQCRRPRVPWRQARRLHRQPTTPGRTGPGPGDPKAPTPQSGPSKASRARPRQSTAESGPALARASCPGARNHQRTGGILHRQGMVVGWGSTKMMSEAESKARPDT